MSEVDTQTVEWLWEPYIPFGKVTIVQGNPGEGKTTFALRLAAACTTGGTLPGMKPLPPFQVIYQTAEDGLGDTVKPRLMEAEADLDRVLVIDEAKRELTPVSYTHLDVYKRQPIQDEYRQIRWKGKQEKFAEAHRAELTLWDAANRYLHAHLPEGVKTLPISAWEKEYTALKTQRDSDYTKLKDTRAEVAELQKIRRCVDIALRADQPEQTRTKRHDIDR